MSETISLSLTETAILTAIRAFILAVCPAVSPAMVIRGQQNRSALPLGPNWIKLQPITRPRLSTNTDSFSYNGTITTQSMTATYRQDVQIDCFGPLAADNAQVIGITWRDGFAVDMLATTGVTPLYTGELRNFDFVNDQDQYEYRWCLDLAAEIDPVVTVTSQSANGLNLGLISVEEMFPAT